LHKETAIRGLLLSAPDTTLFSDIDWFHVFSVPLRFSGGDFLLRQDYSCAGKIRALSNSFPN
jgi:hypothetical protein